MRLKIAQGPEIVHRLDPARCGDVAPYTTHRNIKRAQQRNAGQNCIRRATRYETRRDEERIFAENQRSLEECKLISHEDR